MKSTRTLLVSGIGILLLITLFLFSCGGGNIVSMEGTWTLTTIPDDDNPHFGDGSYTLTLNLSSEELKLDAYSGEGLIDDEPYNFSVWIKHEPDNEGNDYYMFIYKDGESLYDDSLECYGTHNFNISSSGQYEGNGSYESFSTGTFSTIKQ